MLVRVPGPVKFWDPVQVILTSLPAIRPLIVIILWCTYSRAKPSPSPSYHAS